MSQREGKYKTIRCSKFVEFTLNLMKTAQTQDLPLKNTLERGL